MYLLERQWECALTEIALSTYSEQKTALIYVCLDIVEESYMKETFLPILRSLLTSEEDTVDLEFNTAYYMRLRHQDLNRVRIFIRDDRWIPAFSRSIDCTARFTSDDEDGFDRSLRSQKETKDPLRARPQEMGAALSGSIGRKSSSRSQGSIHGG